MKFLPLKKENINTEGAIRLAEKTLSESSEAFLNAWVAYLKNPDDEWRRKEADREERWFRNNRIINTVGVDVEDVIRTLKKRAERMV